MSKIYDTLMYFILSPNYPVISGFLGLVLEKDVKKGGPGVHCINFIITLHVFNNHFNQQIRNPHSDDVRVSALKVICVIA